MQATTPLRFRSKRSFLWVRCGGVCLVPTLIAGAAVATEGAVISTTICILMVGIALVVIYRLLRACVIVDETQFISRGFLRDRAFPRNQVAGVVADRTWYLSKRLMVPATLFLVLNDGRRVRVPGVQSFVGNIGVWHVPLQEAIERSYPREVARQLNELIEGSAAPPESKRADDS